MDSRSEPRPYHSGTSARTSGKCNRVIRTFTQSVTRDDVCALDLRLVRAVTNNGMGSRQTGGQEVPGSNPGSPTTFGLSGSEMYAYCTLDVSERPSCCWCSFAVLVRPACSTQLLLDGIAR